jgi:hypothetical protein
VRQFAAVAATILVTVAVVLARRRDYEGAAVGDR